MIPAPNQPNPDHAITSTRPYLIRESKQSTFPDKFKPDDRPIQTPVPVRGRPEDRNGFSWWSSPPGVSSAPARLLAASVAASARIAESRPRADPSAAGGFLTPHERTRLRPACPGISAFPGCCHDQDTPLPARREAGCFHGKARQNNRCPILFHLPVPD